LTTYTRASKFASTLDDSYSLDIHHQKETAVGIFENRFILNKIGEARVEEGVDPSTEIRTDLFDHNKLTDVINIARAKAGTHSKSSWGTRLHKQTEALDKGEQPFDDPVAQPDLDAYEWETQLLEFDQIERFCVNDEVQAAGHAGPHDEGRGRPDRKALDRRSEGAGPDNANPNPRRLDNYG